MGSGKSVLGKELAGRLERSFYDLDDFIEAKAGKSISDIFNQYGEYYFRKLERTCLKEIVKKSNAVIALGGGAACFYDHISYINQTSFSIYLRLTPKGLVERLKDNTGNRPLLKDLTDKELQSYVTNRLKQRSVFYEQADLTIDNLELKSTLERIIRKLPE